MANLKLIAAPILLLLGLAFLIIGLVMPGVIDGKLNSTIDEKLVVSSMDHEEYENWTTNRDEDDAPEYLNVYVWNITNVEKAVDGEEKLNLVQVGPYAFRQYKEKLDVSFGNSPDQMTEEEGNLVQFKLWKYWVWDKEASGEGLDMEKDEFVTVNLVYAGIVANLGFGTESGYRAAGNRLFWGEDDFEMVKLQDLAFGGPSPIFPNITSADEARDTLLYDILYTGLDDMDQRGQYVQWQGLATIEDVWESPQDVVGGTGTEWPRHLDYGATLTTWQPDLLRPIPLFNDGEEDTDLYGIKLLRHYVDTTYYQNQETNPVNSKYMMDSPNGLIPLHMLKDNVPIFVSIPHFYSADRDEVINTVRGCDPQKEIHASIIDVDPITGLAMRARRRVQINIQVGPTDTFAYNSLEQAYLPILWFEESGELQEKQAEEYKDSVYGAIKLKNDLLISGTVLGSVFLLSGIVLGALVVRQRKAQFTGAAQPTTNGTPMQGYNQFA